VVGRGARLRKRDAVLVSGIYHGFITARAVNLIYTAACWEEIEWEVKQHERGSGMSLETGERVSTPPRRRST
jgi:hypothetical protein